MQALSYYHDLFFFFLPETIDIIFAGASIATRGAVAFVNVDLTAIPRESNGAVAAVVSCQVFTHSSVQTRAGQTLVDFELTERTCGNLTGMLESSST